MRRTSIASLAAVAGLSLVAGVAGPAAATVTTAGGPTETATVLLRGADPSGATALAGTPVVSRSTRAAVARLLQPSAAQQQSVRAVAARLGVRVTGTVGYALTVRGPAGALEALRAQPGVSAVVTGHDGVPLHPMATYNPGATGAAFRTAYNASAAAPVGGTPTIATIQFAGWNSSDLTHYAQLSGVSTPPSVFTPVSVDGADTTTVAPDSGSGSPSMEVALDQESIWAVDPYAKQRAYFAPNTGQGQLDAIERIIADATADPSIVAVSTSWGACEYQQTYGYSDFSYVDAVHQALTQLTALGVTVFAASGDDGAYDCRDGATVSVDYPASDPAVVAVGGTRLASASPANESAWSYHDYDGQGDYVGSGGGQSAHFPRPAWQTTTAATREVPDIAANASDLSQMGIYFSLYGQVGVFGTSEAAPVSAAAFTAELGARGVTSGGVGDIHSGLYAAPAGSFRDITTGWNGVQSGAPGYDMVTGLGAPNWGALLSGLLAAPALSAPAVSASRTIPVHVAGTAGQAFTGWSAGTGTAPACTGATSVAAPTSVTAPGDGATVVWVEAYLAKSRCLLSEVATTVDSTKPSIVPSARASSASGKKVTFAWSVADAGTGVATVNAMVVRNGKAIWSGTTAGSSSVTLAGTLGSVYRLQVTALDRAGNVAQTSKGLDVAYDDRGFHLSKGWKRVKSHAAFGGTLIGSATKGAKATVKAYASTYSLITTLCKTCGVVQVYVNGKHYRDINLYSKVTRSHRLVKLVTTHSARVRTITLVVKGGKAAKGRGTTVYVDGLLVS